MQDQAPKMGGGRGEDRKLTMVVAHLRKLSKSPNNDPKFAICVSMITRCMFVLKYTHTHNIAREQQLGADKQLGSDKQLGADKQLGVEKQLFQSMYRPTKHLSGLLS